MHQRSAAFLFLFAASTVVAGTLSAQTASTLAAIDQGCWLHDDDDGHPFGFGPDYQVHFRPHGCEFVPVLGKAAPHDLPVQFTVTHVGRGEPVAVGAGRRESHGLRVDYVRAAVVERLELRPEGLEQSFCFATLPPGEGDLVVRLAMRTELQAEAVDASRGVTLSWPGVGGVHIGGVLGIDAAGRRCEGALRCRDGQLEYSLPAAFVATAQLPLVLDPLISTVLTVSGNAADERQVSVSRLSDTSTLSAVVWRRTISATNDDGYVAIVNDTGAVGSAFGFENSINVSTDRPRIAAAPGANAWLVAWNQGGDVFCRRVLTGGVSAMTTIANGTGVETAVVVAGGAGLTPDRVFVAWLDDTADAIRGCEVDASSSPPQKFATSTLVTDAGLFTNLEELELPRDSASPKLLLTYTTRSTVTNDVTLRGLFFVAATPTVGAGASFPIGGSSNTSVLGPAVAGDGRTWVVAYRTLNPISGNGASCVAVHQNGTAAVLGTPRALVASGTNVADLDAAWAGGSALIAMARVNGTLHDVVLFSIDPLVCSDCEGVLTVDVAGNDTTVGVAAGADGNAAVVWAPVAGGLGNVSLQRFRGEHGDFVDIASGPFGENVTATCARVGRADFGIELHGGGANTPTFALLAGARIDAPCGFGNVIVPDLFGGFVFAAGSTSAVGDLRLVVPIPNNGALAGAGLFVQFAKLGGSCFGSLDLSNTVQFVIQ